MVGAHLTLFHHLPGDEEAAIRRELGSVAGFPLAARVTGLRSLGRGVAFDVEAPELVALRAVLAGRWQTWLTPQDRAWSRPHVTIQNKVAPGVARATLAELERSFAPWECTVERLALWRYAGGGWVGPVSLK